MDDSWIYELSEEDIKVLMKYNSLRELTRTPINDEQKKIVEKLGTKYLPFDNGHIPTLQEVIEWHRSKHPWIGLSSTDLFICIKSKVERLGIDEKCSVCGGDGHIWYSDEIKQLSENFERYDPPIGRGYQLWETTSEGSPISPVFDTFFGLCEWLVPNETIFGYEYLSKDQWIEALSYNPLSFRRNPISFNKVL